ncbi:MAG: LysM peptidoglycan-binding domain-containing protein, partial [Actinobacteria bacterium]|nr:LysM peptidoglycan-binding domain-containing protein [Actinomycetota bacterium]
TNTTEPEQRPTTSAPQTVYTVQTGDSLSRIASRFNTTIEDLREANGLSTNVIRAGQRLRIPSGSQAPTTQDGDQQEPVITTPTTVRAPTSDADDGRVPVLLGGLLVAAALAAGLFALVVRGRRRRRGGNGPAPEGTPRVAEARIGNPVGPSAPDHQPMAATTAPARPGGSWAPAREAVPAKPGSPRPGPLTAVREAAAAAPAGVPVPTAVRTKAPVVRPTALSAVRGHDGFQVRVVGLAPMHDQSRDSDMAGFTPAEHPLAVRPCPHCGTIQSVGELGGPCMRCGEYLPAGSTYPWPVVLVPNA